MTSSPVGVRTKKKSSALAPLAPLFSFLNWVAHLGWSYVLYMLLMFDRHSQNNNSVLLLDNLQRPVLVLEGICVMEVIRILLNDLPGNLVLGVILHAIRITAILEVLPRAAKVINDNNNESSSLSPLSDPRGWSWTVSAVLASWAVTEVTRYPMYLFPSSGLCRSVRMVVPLVTFPIGAVAEFCGAYQVFFVGRKNDTTRGTTTDIMEHDGVPIWLQVALMSMMFVNGVLGPTLAYPALLKKGLPVLKTMSLSKLIATEATSSSSSKPKIRTA